jgi:hypothetical protein
VSTFATTVMAEGKGPDYKGKFNGWNVVRYSAPDGPLLRDVRDAFILERRGRGGDWAVTSRTNRDPSMVPLRKVKPPRPPKLPKFKFTKSYSKSAVAAAAKRKRKAIIPIVARPTKTVTARARWTAARRAAEDLLRFNAEASDASPPPSEDEHAGDDDGDGNEEADPSLLLRGGGGGAGGAGGGGMSSSSAAAGSSSSTSFSSSLGFGAAGKNGRHRTAAASQGGYAPAARRGRPPSKKASSASSHASSTGATVSSLFGTVSAPYGQQQAREDAAAAAAGDDTARGAKKMRLGAAAPVSPPRATFVAEGDADVSIPSLSEAGAEDDAMDLGVVDDGNNNNNDDNDKIDHQQIADPDGNQDGNNADGDDDDDDDDDKYEIGDEDGNALLPGLIDPITLAPVVFPAISPYGHVAERNSWSRWLSLHKMCPITRKPLSKREIVVLTPDNIDLYRDKIVNYTFGE